MRIALQVIFLRYANFSVVQKTLDFLKTDLID